MRENLEKRPLRVVGMRQVLRAVREDKALKVYLAMDADPAIRSELAAAVNEKQLPLGKVGSMRALAHMCNVDVPTSCAALLKDAKTT